MHTWDETSAKFDMLAAGHVGAPLRRDIKGTVRSLEEVQPSDLTKLLRELNCKISNAAISGK